MNDAYTIGKKVFIRTVTYHYTGKIVENLKKQLVLKDAAWIADCGRYNECLVKGTFSEVEPIVGPVILNKDAIVDCVEWNHDLPMSVK